MKRYAQLIEECLRDVREVFPWDLEEWPQGGADPLFLDVREPYEYEAMRIAGSLNVPRGILEQASEYGFEETVPELVRARQRPIVVVCRSGYRSVLAAFNMQLMGYENVRSLKTGLRGWNDDERPLVDGKGRAVSVEDAEAYFAPQLRPEQMGPGNNV